MFRSLLTRARSSLQWNQACYSRTERRVCTSSSWRRCRRCKTCSQRRSRRARRTWSSTTCHKTWHRTTSARSSPALARLKAANSSETKLQVTFPSFHFLNAPNEQWHYMQLIHRFLVSLKIFPSFHACRCLSEDFLAAFRSCVVGLVETLDCFATKLQTTTLINSTPASFLRQNFVVFALRFLPKNSSNFHAKAINEQLPPSKRAIPRHAVRWRTLRRWRQRLLSVLLQNDQVSISTISSFTALLFLIDFSSV